MNPQGHHSSGSRRCFRKPPLLGALLAACVVLTGCPHNDYTVDLKPTANGLERTLTFYRADGSSNGVPNYLEFSTNELAEISRVYPAGAVKADGKRFVARGEFAGPMPDDIGGAGSYSRPSTSLGTAGFYLERFRGDDDLAGGTEKQFRAADQITDLVIGWARTEFGQERGWEELRKFLDGDFRHDLKNAGLYFRTGRVCNLSDTNAPDEFAARFARYLLDRGYLMLSDAPKVSALIAEGMDSSALPGIIQRLAAEKMGLAPHEPRPKSFAALADAAALEKSWEHYLAQTDLYRAKLADWEQKIKANPKLEQPKPSEALDGLIPAWLGVSAGNGETDHLTVRLALNRAPDHSNGKWQEGKVVWGVALEPDRALPVLCYASWSNPDEQFQSAHFGKVVLAGDELAQYCLWQSGLDGKLAAGWETLLAGLQPGDGLKEKLEAFKFSGQPDSGRNLLVKALAKAPGKSDDSK